MSRLARSCAWIGAGGTHTTSRGTISARMRERKTRRIRPTLTFGCGLEVVRCLPCELPEFSHKSNILKHRFGFGCGLGLPLRVQAVAVPELRQFPALGQRQRTARGTLPLFAPAVDVLFRPEQEHGASGKGDVFVPLAGGNRDVDDARTCS